LTNPITKKCNHVKPGYCEHCKNTIVGSNYGQSTYKAPHPIDVLKECAKQAYPDYEIDEESFEKAKEYMDELVEAKMESHTDFEDKWGRGCAYYQSERGDVININQISDIIVDGKYIRVGMKNGHEVVVDAGERFMDFFRDYNILADMGLTIA